MVASTHALDAPYDQLRPMRCRQTRDGRVCNKALGDIDWSVAGAHARTCPRCGTQNLVVVSPTVCVVPEGV